jgi:hypothetical protein
MKWNEVKYFVTGYLTLLEYLCHMKFAAYMAYCFIILSYYLVSFLSVYIYVCIYIYLYVFVCFCLIL